MNDEGDFVFAEEYHPPDGLMCFVGTMPQGISDADQLLEALSDTLKFPGYFGANWNAVWDCMMDFDWLEEAVIILQHRDMPVLNTHDLRIYVGILRDAVAGWAKLGDRRLVVVFPTSSRSEIRLLLQAGEGKISLFRRLSTIFWRSPRSG